MIWILAAAFSFAQAGDFDVYRESVKGSEQTLSFEMVPISGLNKVDSFWMASREMTWEIYDLYAFGGGDGLDGVTAPTQPFVDPTFEYGHDGYPVISVTHHAAMEFCRWLSLKTGHLYRLPTDAEWEFVARAGETQSSAAIGDFAWTRENSARSPHPAGLKKPNPLSVFDIFGNVAEWVQENAVRGGSWNEPASKANSAYRALSDASWSKRDPNFPKSIWWHTDAHHVGFRVVRPLREQK